MEKNMEKMEDCRFYPNPSPKIDDLVIAKIYEVTDMGAKCSLLEYNNLDAFLPITEFSKRRFKSAKQIVRVGNIDVLQVIRVSDDYIDVSKKVVTFDETESQKIVYEKQKAFHNIIRRTAFLSKSSLLDFYTRFGWIVYNDLFNETLNKNENENCLTKLEYITENSETLSDYDISDIEQLNLLKLAKTKFAEKNVKVEALIDVTCYGMDGINAIKDSLRSGQKIALNHNLPIEIKLVNSPTYSISMITKTPKDIVPVFQEIIDEISNQIVKYKGGAFELKSKIQIVTY